MPPHPVLRQHAKLRFVGDDGPTHHGAYDLSYLRVVPNMMVAAPKDESELRKLGVEVIDYKIATQGLQIKVTAG